jgi:Flp pilus assembly protein TadD
VRARIQLARQQAPAEALVTLAAAEKLAPEDAGVPAEKGRILLESGNAAAALAEFGRALALAPSDARAVNNRGVALLRLNQREAAIADFRRALEMDPCLFDARRNLYAAGEKALPPPGHCSYTPEQKDSLPR